MVADTELLSTNRRKQTIFCEHQIDVAESLRQGPITPGLRLPVLFDVAQALLVDRTRSGRCSNSLIFPPIKFEVAPGPRTVSRRFVEGDKNDLIDRWLHLLVA